MERDVRPLSPDLSHASPSPPAREGADDAVFERHGGLVVSVAFHLALFVLMFNESEPRSAPTIEPATIRVEFEPDPTPEPTPAASPEPERIVATPPPEAPATVLEADETIEEPVDEVAESPEERPVEFEPSDSPEVDEFVEEIPEPVEPPETESPPEGRDPDSPAFESGYAEDAARDEAERIEAERRFARELEDRQEREILRELNRELAEEGSSEVEARLRLARVDQSAKKWLATDEGRAEGVIRALDVSGVPQQISNRVLAKYGIDILIKQLDGSAQGSGYNFLNRAKAGGDVYYNRVGRGTYQVFSYGQAAISRMMQLETDELKKRGLDPRVSRVLEVEFGIVETTGGYDLGVRKLRCAPIQ